MCSLSTIIFFTKWWTSLHHCLCTMEPFEPFEDSPSKQILSIPQLSHSFVAPVPTCLRSCCWHQIQIEHIFKKTDVCIVNVLSQKSQENFKELSLKQFKCLYAIANLKQRHSIFILLIFLAALNLSKVHIKLTPFESRKRSHPNIFNHKYCSCTFFHWVYVVITFCFIYASQSLPNFWGIWVQIGLEKMGIYLLECFGMGDSGNNVATVRNASFHQKLSTLSFSCCKQYT